MIQTQIIRADIYGQLQKPAWDIVESGAALEDKLTKGINKMNTTFQTIVKTADINDARRFMARPSRGIRIKNFPLFDRNQA